MAVHVFDPQISLTLKKNIGRTTISGGTAVSQRFQGSPRTLDLAPWIGEAGQVVVRKSVREPDGQFTIVLADRFDADTQDSLYAGVEPLDVIDIRMARDTSKYYTQGLTDSMPIMMRGIVSKIQRAEIMPAEGGPQRAVVITGQDYGKLLQMTRIYYLANMVLGQDLLTQFKLFVNFNIDSDAFQDASTFVKAVMDGPVAKLIADMRSTVQSGDGSNQSPIMDILLDATVHNASVSPFGTNAWPGGTVYELLRYFGDVGPWNELFIEDREDAPYLVYRPNPFKDTNGQFIQPLDKPPAVVSITDEAVIKLAPERSDAGVYNFFWTDLPAFTQVDGILINAYAAQNTTDVYLKDYPNATPSLYGIRLLETESQQGPRIDGNTKGKLAANEQTVLDFLTAKRKVIADTNKDNVVFENGTAELRGDESVKAGTILQITRGAGAPGGGLTSEYYVPAVTHVFQPFQSYRTTVEFERGTGFIERVQRDGGAQSPYLTELSASGVYGTSGAGTPANGSGNVSSDFLDVG